MRGLLWIIIAAAGANAAQAQLRLPGALLPALPTQKLTQTVNQTAANSLEQLSDVRHLLIAGLIRANPRTVAADPHGNPIVRDELLAVSPSAQAMEAALAMGFRIIREQTIEDLDIHLVVLQVPANLRMTKALAKLREADAAGIYDFNHIYTGGGVVNGTSPATAASPAPASPAPASPVTAVGARVGLIDSGVDIAHPVFHDAVIHTWGCQHRALASSHGTAVASLLAGQAGGFRGVLVKAELFAADVYCGEPTGGAVDALAAAFSWLAQQHVAVINMSLVGPDNAALAQIVRALSARGYVLVAAVGNDGPAAPPLYPASYPHVIGVTAVDAHRRALIEAARGKQVMFAAQGADMAAADAGGRYSAVRGTSFAAPIVAALLAETISVPDVSAGEAAVEELARRAIDLGPPGRDLTYGFGLVGAERISVTKEEMPKGARINW
jgi:subtilisin family serine protease